ncbi:hypothetical protein BLNAU_6678 [Blattamonas nauphoetae]|uniref:Uncharacterized protein n=1 Tax=Blattamonas nauphoetae TaxID=2049346 RepID=A0ABQ9Y3T7_9EUKA|nr:hypothetical protein BLNAU_6678 [Blattamonas nauphoetae]
MTLLSKHTVRQRYSTLDIKIMETFERNWFSQHLKQGTEEHEKHQQYCLPRRTLDRPDFRFSRDDGDNDLARTTLRMRGAK